MKAIKLVIECEDTIRESIVTGNRLEQFKAVRYCGSPKYVKKKYGKQASPENQTIGTMGELAIADQFEHFFEVNKRSDLRDVVSLSLVDNWNAMAAAAAGFTTQNSRLYYDIDILQQLFVDSKATSLTSNNVSLPREPCKNYLYTNTNLNFESDSEGDLIVHSKIIGARFGSDLEPGHRERLYRPRDGKWHPLSSFLEPLLKL
jgi:hypothetical protein